MSEYKFLGIEIPKKPSISAKPSQYLYQDIDVSLSESDMIFDIIGASEGNYSEISGKNFKKHLLDYFLLKINLIKDSDRIIYDGICLYLERFNKDYDTQNKEYENKLTEYESKILEIKKNKQKLLEEATKHISNYIDKL